MVFQNLSIFYPKVVATSSILFFMLNNGLAFKLQYHFIPLTNVLLKTRYVLEKYIRIKPFENIQIIYRTDTFSKKKKSF